VSSLVGLICWLAGALVVVSGIGLLVATGRIAWATLLLYRQLRALRTQAERVRAGYYKLKPQVASPRPRKRRRSRR
jgi:hypothetical protein